jgi:hypothetical protein
MNSIIFFGIGGLIILVLWCVLAWILWLSVKEDVGKNNERE